MKGFILTYKGDKGADRVKLNHYLFGRISYKNYRGGKIAYYMPGLLDSHNFMRLQPSKIFLETIDDLDLDELNEFGSFEVKECEREESKIIFVTGREYWLNMARERGYPIRIGRGGVK